MKLLIVNGPNLNWLGRREPNVYGSGTMDECLEALRRRYPDDEIDYYQSNIEGELIDRLQRASDEGVEGIALNAGAYTHTSLALADCIRSLGCPVVELHITNVHRREEIRHRSLLAPACRGIVCGFGQDSYRLALEALKGAQ
ncbi:MAG: type II 3-dehydroquinate dehydratase [Alloprevotella sp.]|nr:type II 3-dehydroquinate dehydratase [Alloprevotella sp.]